MDLIIGFGVFFGLLGLGFFVGGFNERRHFAHIALREANHGDMLVTQTKNFPLGVAIETAPTMVTGEVVIATDYLKNYFAKWRNIFGGRVRSYQSLLERARREAILRMLDEASARGLNALCNVRLETADVGGNTAQRKVAMVAIIASGTAYYAEPPSV